MPRHATLLLLLLAPVLAGCKRDRPAAERRDAARPPTRERPQATRRRLTLIDSHVHITPLPEAINYALRLFSTVGVEKFATKSAGVFGTPRFEATAHFAQLLGERMAFFANVDWEGIDDRRWGRREADRMEGAMRAGASGIKIFKALGLGVRLKNGKLLAPDDRRLEPLWRRAAKLKAIVAWHVADPVAFFEPVTPENERYEELSHAPEWSFHGGDYPSHEALLAARDRVIARHPETIFLGIHLANYPENLDYVDKLLRRHKNLYVDVSARLPEIGRHPAEKVRAFFIRHQDRVLFGTDLIVGMRGLQLGSLSERPPTFDDAVKFFEAHRRFFETDARQIDHPTPIQGRWKIDAIDLPPDVLQKIYSENAERLIFAPRRRWLAAHSGDGLKK